MPRYYCDYCDTFLTHESPVVRKQHNSGFKHKANVRNYYMQFEESQTQSAIDDKIMQFAQHARPALNLSQLPGAQLTAPPPGMAGVMFGQGPPGARPPAGLPPPGQPQQYRPPNMGGHAPPGMHQYPPPDMHQYRPPSMPPPQQFRPPVHG